jgi:hypothetical protein
MDDACNDFNPDLLYVRLGFTMPKVFFFPSARTSRIFTVISMGTYDQMPKTGLKQTRAF